MAPADLDRAPQGRRAMVRDFPRPAIVILSITVLAVAVLLFGGAGLPPRSVSFSQSTKDLEGVRFRRDYRSGLGASRAQPIHGCSHPWDVREGGRRQTALAGGRVLRRGGRKRVPHPIHAAGAGRLYLLGRVSPRVVEHDLDRHVSCERRPPPRPGPDRSARTDGISSGKVPASTTSSTARPRTG